MESVGEDCKELKHTYDECFNNWFANKFLKGVKDDPCKTLFEVYQTCVKKALNDKKIDVVEMEENFLGTDKEKQAPS